MPSSSMCIVASEFPSFSLLKSTTKHIMNNAAMNVWVRLTFQAFYFISFEYILRRGMMTIRVLMFNFWKWSLSLLHDLLFLSFMEVRKIGGSAKNYHYLYSIGLVCNPFILTFHVFLLFSSMDILLFCYFLKLRKFYTSLCTEGLPFLQHEIGGPTGGKHLFFGGKGHTLLCSGITLGSVQTSFSGGGGSYVVLGSIQGHLLTK